MIFQTKQFAALVFKRDRLGHRLTLEELILLNILYLDQRIDLISAQKAIQRDFAEAHRILEALRRDGLIVASEKGDQQIYELSLEMQKKLGLPVAPARLDRFDRIRQEEPVMEARRVLERMRAADKLKPEGKPPRWVYYVSTN